LVLAHIYMAPPQSLPAGPYRFLAYRVNDTRKDYWAGVVVFPYWILTLGLSLMPALLLWKQACAIRSRRWVAKGLCGGCGYDLRATPDLCPECGAIPPAAKGP
jgi:hypothetical protein